MVDWKRKAVSLTPAKSPQRTVLDHSKHTIARRPSGVIPLLEIALSSLTHRNQQKRQRHACESSASSGPVLSTINVLTILCRLNNLSGGQWCNLRGDSTARVTSGPYGMASISCVDDYRRHFIRWKP